MDINDISDEKMTAFCLIKNINDGNLINRDLSSIYRILGLYLDSPNRKHEDDEIIIDFLFKCIDKYGKKASVLFSHVDDQFDVMKIIKKINDGYQNKIDIHYINPIVLHKSLHLLKVNDKMTK